MKKFTIFGNPVAHSKSPNMHNAGFAYKNIDANYEKTHLENGKNLKETFLKNDFSGANITVPHKEEAYRQANEIVGMAKQIGAVNTYIHKDEKIYAYNTDAPGFIKAIQEFDDIQPIKNVLVFGAGGTAKAIAVALKDKNITVSVINRSKNKLGFFQKLGCDVFTWDEFDSTNNQYDLMVNSTSAGLKDEELPAPKELLQSLIPNAKFVFDCIYGKQTPFLKFFKECCLKSKDGEDMLLYQGVLAFELFTDTMADDRLVETMRNGLKNQAET